MTILHMDQQRLRLLLTALAAGDSLGSTSEFSPQGNIPDIYDRYAKQGWPFAQVGGGPFNWPPGAPTDDSAMAFCLVRACLDTGGFDGDAVARQFVGWLDSHPPDIGAATRRGLLEIKRGVPWYRGGQADYRHNPHSAGNGSLMRNAPVVAVAGSLTQAWRLSLLQSLITHYGPLPVLCCCAQTYLLWLLIESPHGISTQWPKEFIDSFDAWLHCEKDAIVRDWIADVPTLRPAIQTFAGADFDPATFNPFGYAFAGADGYCLLTLQIAVWAMHHCQRDTPVAAPPGFPAAPFAKAIGPLFGGIIPLIGHDSDTYSATAFPLIAAVHGSVPEEMTQGLGIMPELNELGL